MKVQAIKLGYYDHKRRRVGEIFEIKKGVIPSKIWMKVLSEDEEEAEVSGEEVHEHKAKGHGKHKHGKHMSSGNEEVI